MNLNGLCFLIFGGGGFIGSHVVSKLLLSGASVRVFDRSPAHVAHQNLEWIIGSAEEGELIAEAAKGCDYAAYLVAGGVPAGRPNLEDELRNHVMLPVEVARICGDNGVRSFVFASSGGTVYGVDSVAPINENTSCWPRNMYGASKLACEHYLRLIGRSVGMATVSLRISNPYGAHQIARGGQGFIAAAMESLVTSQPLVIWGDGSVVRDFVYVEDVAEAIVSACIYSGTESVINIGSGVGVSLAGILDVMQRVLGRRPETTFEPDRVVDVKANILDTKRAADTLGWKPTVSLDVGLANTYKWWMNRAARTA